MPSRLHNPSPNYAEFRYIQKYARHIRGVLWRQEDEGNLARVETKGGYWRWAHDGWLETVYADCAHHGLRVAREITGLFRSAIPLPGERALFDRRPWNVRRGMIPDGSVATGHGPGRLLECKVLHWGVSTYTEADLEHEGRCRAVERRAGKVHDDYVKAAAKLDAAH